MRKIGFASSLLTYATIALLMPAMLGCAESGSRSHSNSVGTDTTAIQDSLRRVAQQRALQEQQQRYWNDLARYFAGLNPLPGSVLDSLERRPEAEAHRAFFNKAWANKQKAMLTELNTWTAAELPLEHSATRNVFYPFGGADFVTIHTLFPKASRYVLYGLEPEGNLPEVNLHKISAQRMGANLGLMQKELKDILQLSFFKTIEMDKDFRNTDITGTGPILMAFLARTGHRVLDVKHVKLTYNGTLGYMEKGAPQKLTDSLLTGLEYTFRDEPSGEPRKLYFFQLNVNNDGLKRHPNFSEFIRGWAPTTTYMKAASYLCYDPFFSKISALIQEVSEVILEDDSGIPLRAFDPKAWNLSFYGTYNRPIALFANKYQPALYKIYHDSAAPIKPLGFGIGYQMVRGTSNLMLARKKPVAGTSTAQQQDSAKPRVPAQPAAH